MEGTQAATIAAGALTDVNDNPMSAFTATYALDRPTTAMPVPLRAVNPVGSFVYTSSTTTTATGIIGTADDADAFTVSLDAGQTVTALVTPGAGLRPTVAVRGPGG